MCYWYPTLLTCICANPLPNSVCLVALTGLMIPSPLVPRPIPLLQPILASILLPNPVVYFSQRPKSFSIVLDCCGNDGRGLDRDEEPNKVSVNENLCAWEILP